MRYSGLHATSGGTGDACRLDVEELIDAGSSVVVVVREPGEERQRDFVRAAGPDDPVRIRVPRLLEARLLSGLLACEASASHSEATITLRPGSVGQLCNQPERFDSLNHGSMFA
jgi:hypothetical protein